MVTSKQQLPPMLIICPASLTFHWMDEINKFFLISPSPVTSSSSSSTGQQQPQQLFFRPVLCDKEFFQTQNKHNNNNIDTNDYNLFIVSYDLFRRESSFFLSIFWDCILLDEAHLIRNPNILITKLIFQLKSSCRLLLTGTPLQNYLEDLWSLMHFLLPNYLGNYSHFQKHYLLPIKKSIETIKFFQSNVNTTTVDTSSNNQKEQEKEKELETRDMTKKIPMTKPEQRQQEKEQEKKNFAQQLTLKKHSQISIKGMELLHYLHQQILPFILRRTKEEVLQDLPAKTIVNILCPLSALQKKMYEEVLQKYSQNDQTLLETILPPPSNPSSKLPTPPTAADINVGDDENDEEQRENQNLYEEIIQLPSTSSSSINRKKVNLFQFQLHANQDKHDPPSNNKMEKKNPLQFLSYLQSICCHPLMVMNFSKHSKYYENLSNQLEISGKFLQLMNLLMEIDILGPDDFILSPSSPILSSHGTYRRRSHRSGRGSSPQDFPFKNFQEFKNSISELSEGNRSFCKNPEEDKNDLDGDDGHNANDQAAEEEADSTRMEESDSDESLSSSSSTSEEEKTEETRHDDTTHSKKKNEADKNNEDQQQRNAFSSSRSRKCLIFVKHQQSLALLEKLVFQKYFPRVKYDRLDGSVPPQKRFQIAKAFNRRKSTEPMTGKKNPEMPLFPSIILEEKEKKTEVNRDEGEGEDEEDEDDDGPRILLMTTRSCGLGLNLSSADTVIFLEHDWNPYVDLQAMDRVHRIGQLNPVTIYRLLADAPIENRIISSQDLKTNIADEVSPLCLFLSKIH
jgi:TATA-binding protein-associated factor